MTKYEKMRCFNCGSVNILFSYATGYECKDCGAKSGDPEGFVYDFIFPVKEDQQATIAQLTAERDILQDKFETLELDYRDVCQKRLEAADSFSKQIIDLTNDRDELRADAERLVGNYGYYDETINGWACNYCGKQNKHEILISHAPDCPIALHRQLEEKYGGEK